MAEEQTTRSGFVALVGRPNVGKSTLLNAFLGQKVAIVSNRPQTTRNRILGVLTVDSDQIMFVDTPGIHNKRNTINRFMVREALQGAAEVDCLVFVTELERQRHAPVETYALGAQDAYALEQIRGLGLKQPVIIAINKIDLISDRRLLLPAMERWHNEGFDAIVPVSALKRDGLDPLLNEIRSRLNQGPHLYPEDLVTDRAERFLAAEFIREQVFRQAQQEIPYATAVDIERFEERPEKGDVCISATIFVERDSQKAIVIGEKGSRIREIGIRSRAEIGRLLGCTVHLDLTVRVQPHWTRSAAGRRRFGYE